MTTKGRDLMDITVTVLIVTYNHANYIAGAIESALMQRADFPVEILISEDCSTDATREIVERCVKTYPELLTPIFSETNIRSNEVVARGLRRAKGRYVSILDGDDYWTSETKLAEQVSFLEAHSDFSAVFHNALVATGETLTDFRWTPPHQSSVVTKREIWEGNPYATCAGMLRTDCVRSVPAWYADFFPITDWPLYVLCAERGDLAFVDDPVGVYRLHEGGLVSSLDGRSKAEMVEGFYRRMSSVLDPAGAAAARAGCARYFVDWAERLAEEGEVRGALSCLRRAMRTGGVGRGTARRDMFRVGAEILKSAWK